MYLDISNQSFGVLTFNINKIYTKEGKSMNIRPLGDRVLVKRVSEQEKTKGGIVLPDTAKEKPQRGEIIAVGEGRLTEDGKRIPMNVKKGDKVIFAKYAGTEIELDDEEYLLMSESDILAVLE